MFRALVLEVCTWLKCWQRCMVVAGAAGHEQDGWMDGRSTSDKHRSSQHLLLEEPPAVLPF